MKKTNRSNRTTNNPRAKKTRKSDQFQEKKEDSKGRFEGSKSRRFEGSKGRFKDSKGGRFEDSKGGRFEDSKGRRDDEPKSFGRSKRKFEVKKKDDRSGKKPFKKSETHHKKAAGRRFDSEEKDTSREYPEKKSPLKKRFQSNTDIKLQKKRFEKSVPQNKKLQQAHSPEPSGAKTIRLNKYLANSGIAARRKCDELIAQGLVKVNDTVVTEMGYRVKEGEKVYYRGKLVQPVNYVYILLNKPKDYLTTVDDDRERHTVMELISGATEERVYPVGRLDRNTTGLLLLTNDGDLAQKLSHPSFGAQKLYEVELDKPLSRHDMDSIANGVELEDGMAMIDGIDYAHHSKKNIIGISLHVGKNRIVRRIFESMGYEVVRLDRTLYAGLTKKDLPRGRWRYLSEKEIIKLKYLK